jgi:hypothetical protein
MALTLHRSELHRAKAALKKVRDESKHATQQIVHVAAASGSAFGVSYLETAYPDGIGAGIFGVDTSLLLGLVGVAAGATGMVGDKDTADMLESIGIGSLAAYAAKKGREKGAEAKK